MKNCSTKEEKKLVSRKVEGAAQGHSRNLNREEVKYDVRRVGIYVEWQVAGTSLAPHPLPQLVKTLGTGAPCMVKRGARRTGKEHACYLGSGVSLPR